MSGREPESEGEVGLQFSVYPLRQEHLHPAIEAAVQAAAREGVDVAVGPPQHLRPGRKSRSSPPCGPHSTPRSRSGRQ